MADNLLVILSKAPYGYEDAFAGARLALACLVSGELTKVTTLLVADGTLNAMTAQRPEALEMPSNLEALQNLMEMDGEVYCVEEDLRNRVGAEETLDGVKLVTWEEARGIIAQHTLITTF